MHVLNEGVTEVSCRALLYYLVVERGIFTLHQFNTWRLQFQFYGHFKKDMPAEILIEHLEGNKLRQTAAQL